MWGRGMEGGRKRYGWLLEANWNLQVDKNTCQKTVVEDLIPAALPMDTNLQCG